MDWKNKGVGLKLKTLGSGVTSTGTKNKTEPNRYRL